MFCGCQEIGRNDLRTTSATGAIGVGRDCTAVTGNLLREQGMDDVIVVVGGIIPEVDRQPLKDLGISEVFGPGTSTGAIVDYIRESVQDREEA